VREALELSHLIAVMNRNRIEPLDEPSRIYGASRIRCCSITLIGCNPEHRALNDLWTDVKVRC